MKWLLISGYVFVGISAIILCLCFWGKIESILQKFRE